MWHIMKIYAHHGFRESVPCLGCRGNSIKEYSLDYEAMNNDFTMRLGEKSRMQVVTRPKQNARRPAGTRTWTGRLRNRPHWQEPSAQPAPSSPLRDTPTPLFFEDAQELEFSGR